MGYFSVVLELMLSDFWLETLCLIKKVHKLNVSKKNNGHMNVLQRFNALASKKQFLILLTCNFGLDVVWALISILTSTNIVPMCEFTVQGKTFYATSLVLNLIELILRLIILIKIYKGVDYDLTKRSKVGLLILMVCSFSFIVSIVNNLCVGADNAQSAIIMTSIHASFYILGIIGLFMFINGSPVEKSLKTFVKCTPFISITLSTTLAFIPRALISPWNPIANSALSIIIFIVIYLLVRKSIRTQE